MKFYCLCEKEKESLDIKVECSSETEEKPITNQENDCEEENEEDLYEKQRLQKIQENIQLMIELVL